MTPDLPSPAPPPSGLKLAVMQPYFFPYLGYYQLAQAVDRFVFLDDVGYIKQGYINRNSILLRGEAHRFSLPVHKVSSFRPISQHVYTGDWAPFLALLTQAYRRAPHFRPAMDLVQAVLRHPDDHVAVKNARSITLVFDYLGLPLCSSFASALAPADGDLRGQDRVLALCQRGHATTYVNAAGGRVLYDHDSFRAQGLQLRFIRSLPLSYAQQAQPFVPHLSMIDLLMHCAPAQITELLGRCELDL